MYLTMKRIKDCRRCVAEVQGLMLIWTCRGHRQTEKAKARFPAPNKAKPQSTSGGGTTWSLEPWAPGNGRRANRIVCCRTCQLSTKLFNAPERSPMAAGTLSSFFDWQKWMIILRFCRTLTTVCVYYTGRQNTQTTQTTQAR